MFLSKKNAQYLNKPTKGKLIQGRVLPGWQDNQQKEQESSFKPSYQNGSYNKNKQSDLLGEQTDQNQKLQEQKPKNVKNAYFNWDQLNQMNNAECEKRLVEAIVEPVGVKVKPTQNQLQQFAKQAKSMEPSILGSLLISKIQANYPFLVKAKALYTIQYLLKKNPAFCSYFKAQSNLLVDFPQPEDNVDQYRKILKGVLNAIGVSQGEKQEQSGNGQGFNYVDPGYNDSSKQKKEIRQPVGPAAVNNNAQAPIATKKFVGPGQKAKTQQKKNDPLDIFSESSIVSNNNNNNANFDLLSVGSEQQNNTTNGNGISFDELMKGSKTQQPNQQQPSYLNFSL